MKSADQILKVEVVEGKKILGMQLKWKKWKKWNLKWNKIFWVQQFDLMN